MCRIRHFPVHTRNFTAEQGRNLGHEKSQFGNFTTAVDACIFDPKMGTNMRLLGKDKLQVALDKDAQLWLRSWISELVAAHWKDAADLLAQFPLAMATGPDTFIFRVGAAVWNIELAVHFPQEIALVVSMEQAAS